MGEVGRWCGQKFTVSPSVIRGFTGLQVKGSSETESQDSGNQSYVSRKKGNPTEISLTITLNAFTGCDARTEAMWFVNAARDGKTDYFYVGNKKLVTCKVMCTSATVKEVEISAGGKWTKAEVSLTLKQCTKNDGTGGGPSGGGNGSSGSGSSGSSSGSYSSGSNKTSVKSTSTTSSKISGVASKIASKTTTGTSTKTTSSTKDTLKTTATSTKTAVRSATAQIARIVTIAAKTATAAKRTAQKKTTGSSKLTATTK